MASLTIGSDAVVGQEKKDLSARMIVVIFTIALVLKAIVAFSIMPILDDHLGAAYQASMFQDEYDKIAENLVNGLGYRVYPDTSPTMIRTPGFVLILAATFSLFGKSLVAVQMLQFGMSALTAVIVYLICLHCVASRYAAILAAMIFLFHPITLIADTRGGVDTTLALCMTAAIWLCMRAVSTGLVRDYVTFGVAIGFAMLVKPSLALVFPAVCLFFLVCPGARSLSISQRSEWLGRTALIKKFLLSGVVAAFVFSPWVIRNYEISGKFVPSMTVGGLAIFQGVEVVKNANSGKDHRTLLDDAAHKQISIAEEMGLKTKQDFFPQFYDVRDEIGFYGELNRRAWANYVTDPSLIARAVLHNAWAFWLQGRTEKATILNIFLMAPFLIVAIYGAAVAVSRNPVSWALVICVMMFVAPHLLIIALARHCSTLIPIVSVFAGCAILGQIGQRILYGAVSKRRNVEGSLA